MRIVWTEESRTDLVRLDAFLAAVDMRVAIQVVDEIYAAVDRLKQYQDLGVRLDRFEGRELRGLIVGEYEVRYERASERITILRLWHVREDR